MIYKGNVFACKYLRLISICIIVSGAMLLIVGCRNNYSISDISHETSLAFPHSGTVLHSHLDGGFQNSALYAVIACDRSDIHEFLRQLPRSSIVTAKYRGGVSTSSLAVVWWKPDSVRKYVAVETRPSSNSGYIRMLVDLDDSKKAKIYMIDIF